MVNSQIFSFLWIFLFFCNIYENLGEKSADPWLIFAREAKNVLYKCYTNHTELVDSWSCVKQNSLLLYDDIAKADPIPVTDFIELFRRPDLKSWNNGRFANNTQLPARVYDEEKSSWGEELKKRVIETLSKYNIRFKVQKSANGEARRRHRRKNMMMPLMVFGMAVLGVVIIPLSFHVMGSLAGLAVFLGKLALLIASITSLKRLAAQGVHYGLYHTDHHYAYGNGPYPGYLEKSDPQYHRT